MSKLLIRGIILSPLTGSIERCFSAPYEYTISEDVIAGIQAEKQALDILVDSPGGDIFAANAVAMAISDWLVAHPEGRATITIQSMAASAAAALVVGVRAPRCHVACHRNSQLMFHGVYTTVFDGGAQKFSDTAEALDKSNEQIRSALLSRTKTPPALISQWFSEGREGWVSSHEAMEWGIVDEVIDLDAAPESESSQTFLNQLKHNPAMNLRTLKKIFLKNEDVEPEDPEKKPVEGEDPEKKPMPGEDPKKEPMEGEDPEKKPMEGEDPKKEPMEGEDPKKEPMPGECPKKEPMEDEDPEEEITELKKALGKLQETVAALERQLSDAKSTNARLTAGLRTSSATASGASPKTFDAAIRTLRDSNPNLSYNEAFVQAAKRFPRLWKQKMSR
ncbi:MAG: ATP-dependent Clp protease proteolytic subunit [Oligosphaeraceae bacterium]